MQLILAQGIYYGFTMKLWWWSREEHASHWGKKSVFTQGNKPHQKNVFMYTEKLSE